MRTGLSTNKNAEFTLPPPVLMLFDWHGTLVNTHQAMYRAVEEMLLQLEELDLIKHLLPEEQAKTEDDAKLLRYIRIFRNLHPRVLAEQRISRTDIFDALFGEHNVEAQMIDRAQSCVARFLSGRQTDTPIASQGLQRCQKCRSAYTQTRQLPHYSAALPHCC